ncbi:MAG: HAD family phosphatase [Chloroflexota bacterium]
MTDSPPAILFDFGNVLVRWDVRALFARFFPDPEAVEAFLREISFLEWNSHQDKGRSFAEGIALLSAQFPHYESILRYFDKNWAETIRDPIPQTIALARRLKAAGHSLYVLTNSSAEKFPLARQIHPFLAEFNDAIVSGEIGLLKPDPAIFHYALTRVNRAAQDCLFVDDSLPNIETARRLGLIAIHFQSPVQLQRELERLHLI